VKVMVDGDNTWPFGTDDLHAAMMHGREMAANPLSAPAPPFGPTGRVPRSEDLCIGTTEKIAARRRHQSTKWKTWPAAEFL
jgi:hypothetical protein